MCSEAFNMPRLDFHVHKYPVGGCLDLAETKTVSGLERRFFPRMAMCAVLLKELCENNYLYLISKK